MPKPTPKYLAWAQKGSVCPRWPQRTPTARMWNGSWPCTHMRTHEDMQTHAQTCMHTYADMCRHVHTGRHMKIRAEMHADLHMHAHMHTCRLICTRISTHANMHTWTHTHRDRLQMPCTPQPQGLSQPYNHCWSCRGQFGAGKNEPTLHPQPALMGLYSMLSPFCTPLGMRRGCVVRKTLHMVGASPFSAAKREAAHAGNTPQPPGVARITALLPTPAVLNNTSGPGNKGDGGKSNVGRPYTGPCMEARGLLQCPGGWGGLGSAVRGEQKERDV